MSGHNEHYNAIQRLYDARQLNNQRAYEQRLQEAYRLSPELEALDRQQVSGSVQRIKAAIEKNGATSTENVTIPTEGYRAKRAKLLTDVGLSEDYLEMQYQCPLCRDTGYVEGKRCKCFQAAYINLLYRDSALRGALDRENFDSFSYDYYANDIQDPLTGLTPYQNIKTAVATAKDFIAQFDASAEDCRNLIVLGNTGVGKTFLTNCIARELINAGYGVVYLSANELLSILEDYKFRRNTAADTDSVYERYTTALESDLLIIDDLGTEQVNNFSVTQLFNLLNTRQLRRRSTIISTNLSMQNIKQTYSERIFSRIASSYDLIRLFGEDIRLKKL